MKKKLLRHLKNQLLHLKDKKVCESTKSIILDTILMDKISSFIKNPTKSSFFMCLSKINIKIYEDICIKDLKQMLIYEIKTCSAEIREIKTTIMIVLYHYDLSISDDEFLKAVFRDYVFKMLTLVKAVNQLITGNNPLYTALESIGILLTYDLLSKSDVNYYEKLIKRVFSPIIETGSSD